MVQTLKMLIFPVPTYVVLILVMTLLVVLQI